MTVAFYTLGCKVNLYETEVVMNIFKDNGYEIVDFKDKSDIYVINTCTVTNNSDIKSKKSIKHIIKNYPDSILIVMGCLPQINPNEIIKIDGVDIIIGNKDKTNVIEILNQYIKNKKQINKVEDIKNIPFESMEISKFNTRKRGFVKIQDGCNNYCSYCIIPYARGDIRSKPFNDVIREVNNLIDNGYIEIVLTGIHTGHYGKDLKEYDLSDLLNELVKIKDLNRIRISSIEVTDLNDKFLEVLKNKKIVNHLHIPLQSGCNKILLDMNRHYDVDYFINKVKDIRNIRPDISITTDIIVGFPNENEEDFKETINTIKKIGFSRIHVFPYSKRNKTKAATLPNQIDNITKKKRSKLLINLSKELEIKYMNKFIGKQLAIIPEKYINDYLIGHYTNYILVKATGNINEINTIKNVKITKIDYPYLIGE